MERFLWIAQVKRFRRSTSWDSLIAQQKGVISGYSEIRFTGTEEEYDAFAQKYLYGREHHLKVISEFKEPLSKAKPYGKCTSDDPDNCWL